MLHKTIPYPLLLILLIFFIISCEPEIERPAPAYEEARGDADFSVYVALGNSLSAGYADNALYREAQENSFPAVIARKIEYINPDLVFNQALMPKGNGVGFSSGVPLGRLVLNSVSPLELSATPPSEGWQAKVEGPVHNLAVPGATVSDLTRPGLGSTQGNPFFYRFASSEGTTVLQDAIALNPTFFTLWIGNNDILGHALSGGYFVDENNQLAGDAPTPVEEFQESYQQIIDQLTASNANISGAIANLPYVSQIPYFNTVPWNALALDAAQAAQLNAGFEAELRKQVIYQVVEEGARRRIITGTPEQEGLAQRVIYQQAYQQAISQGASPEEAETSASQFVESDQGQAEILALQTNLIENRQPEEVHDLVEQQLNSEPVQDQVNQNFQAALQADQAGQLEVALGEEGAARVEASQTAQLSLLRDLNFFPEFREGPNGFLVGSEHSPTGFRQLTKNEKVLFSAALEGLLSAERLTQFDYILPDRYALDTDEIQLIQTHIDAYNSIIKTIAESNSLALVDMNTFFNQVVAGYTEDGTNFSATYITGNTFSLDGVHLSQKGYALVAERFIETINAYFNSEIPEPNLRNYPAVALP